MTRDHRRPPGDPGLEAVPPGTAAPAALGPSPAVAPTLPATPGLAGTADTVASPLPLRGAGGGGEAAVDGGESRYRPRALLGAGLRQLVPDVGRAP